jgi:hypothetical protein
LFQFSSGFTSHVIPQNSICFPEQNVLGKHHCLPVAVDGGGFGDMLFLFRI